MMKLRWLLILAALLLVTASCRNKGAEVKFARFEKVLFDTQTDQLQGKLEAVRSDFASPLINCVPENPVYMQQLTAFVSDPFVKEIYRLTDSCYGNLSWLEKELSAAVGEAVYVPLQNENCRYHCRSTLLRMFYLRAYAHTI